LDRLDPRALARALLGPGPRLPASARAVSGQRARLSCPPYRIAAGNAGPRPVKGRGRRRHDLPRSPPRDGTRGHLLPLNIKGASRFLGNGLRPPVRLSLQKHQGCTNRHSDHAGQGSESAHDLAARTTGQPPTEPRAWMLTTVVDHNDMQLQRRPSPRLCSGTVPSFPARTTRPRGAGQSARITTSSTSTR
jgi:hypothetical protein